MDRASALIAKRQSVRNWRPRPTRSVNSAASPVVQPMPVILLMDGGGECRTTLFAVTGENGGTLVDDTERDYQDAIISSMIRSAGRYAENEATGTPQSPFAYQLPPYR